MEYFSSHKASTISFATNVPGYDDGPQALFARPHPPTNISSEDIVHEFIAIATEIAKEGGRIYLEDIIKPYVDKLDEMILDCESVGMEWHAKKCRKMKTHIETYANELPITMFNFVSFFSSTYTYVMSVFYFLAKL